MQQETKCPPAEVVHWHNKQRSPSCVQAARGQAASPSYPAAITATSNLWSKAWWKQQHVRVLSFGAGSLEGLGLSWCTLAVLNCFTLTALGQGWSTLPLPRTCSEQIICILTSPFPSWTLRPNWTNRLSLDFLYLCTTTLLRLLSQEIQPQKGWIHAVILQWLFVSPQGLQSQVL